MLHYLLIQFCIHQGRSQDLYMGGASSGQSFIWGSTCQKLRALLKNISFLMANLGINNGVNLLIYTTDVLLIIPCYCNGYFDNVQV